MDAPNFLNWHVCIIGQEWWVVGGELLKGTFCLSNANSEYSVEWLKQKFQKVNQTTKEFFNKARSFMNNQKFYF